MTAIVLAPGRSWRNNNMATVTEISPSSPRSDPRGGGSRGLVNSPGSILHQRVPRAYSPASGAHIVPHNSSLIMQPNGSAFPSHNSASSSQPLSVGHLRFDRSATPRPASMPAAGSTQQANTVPLERPQLSRRESLDSRMSDVTDVAELNLTSTNAVVPRLEGRRDSQVEDKKSTGEFLPKLWSMLENPDTDDVIHWNEDGRTFEYYNGDKFIELLGSTFKTKKEPSFVRQLNAYEFKKIPSTREKNKAQSKWCAFKHVRGKWDRRNPNCQFEIDRLDSTRRRSIEQFPHDPEPEPHEPRFQGQYADLVELCHSLQQQVTMLQRELSHTQNQFHELRSRFDSHTEKVNFYLHGRTNAHHDSSSSTCVTSSSQWRSGGMVDPSHQPRPHRAMSHAVRTDTMAAPPPPQHPHHTSFPYARPPQLSPDSEHRRHSAAAIVGFPNNRDMKPRAGYAPRDAAPPPHSSVMGLSVTRDPLNPNIVSPHAVSLPVPPNPNKNSDEAHVNSQLLSFSFAAATASGQRRLSSPQPPDAITRTGGGFDDRPSQRHQHSNMFTLPPPSCARRERSGADFLGTNALSSKTPSMGLYPASPKSQPQHTSNLSSWSMNKQRRGSAMVLGHNRVQSPTSQTRWGSYSGASTSQNKSSVAYIVNDDSISAVTDAPQSKRHSNDADEPGDYKRRRM